MSFRWKYILLPVIILFLSIVITACFYHLLPGEVAYHFEDGAPDRWMSRGAIIAWLLTPQLFFTLLAGAIVWGVARLSARSWQAANNTVKTVLSLMGNMVALPQLILSFAMLDIFSYNAYKIHLMPLWAFALLVMVLGAIVLGIFFVQTIRRLQATVKATRSDSNGGTSTR